MTPGKELCFSLDTQRASLDVGGWKPEALGLAVAVTLEPRINRLRTFTEAELPALIESLESASKVIGYNLQGFDFRVLQGCGGFRPERIKTRDLMEEVHASCGLRITLHEAVSATLAWELESSGLASVKCWKAGRVDKVVEGCCNVVLAIHRLHEYGRANGKVYRWNRPKGGATKRRVRVPVTW